MGNNMRKASRCFLLAVLVMASAAGSAFAGDDEDEDTFEQKIIKKILGGIGADVGKNRIEYRERSPLVIPPGRDLPPPDSAEIVAGPNWPKDPDQLAKKKSKKPATSDSIVQQKRDQANLSPDEIRRGTLAGAGRVTEPGKEAMDGASEYGGGRPLSPDRLGTKKWFNWFGSKGDQVPFTGEPDRTSLTQPPPGYQTPSPNYPYGLSGGNAPVSSSTQSTPDPAAR
jgi:hypothetical protein